ncbi:MAG: hypothetical protein FWD94_02800 [Treponema sp.]|nr:hypothetical protein [Treponema sp.]
MKKFLAVVFVLIALAGAGLFFGWAQRGVPPDAYGVLRSRSHGTDPELIVPGEFRWVWYRLIPTNAEVYVFRLQDLGHRFRSAGVLPSGATYATFLGLQEDFSWEIDATVRFRLRRDALIPLVERDNLANQQELRAWMENLAEEIGLFVTGWMQENGERTVGWTESGDEGGDSALLAEIGRRFPQIEDFSLRIGSARFPDMALYRQARALYGEFVSLQKDFVSGGMTDLAQGRLQTFMRLEELELYGELLTKFPLLLEFLSIENSRDR